jgi:hypothetical protein
MDPLTFKSTETHHSAGMAPIKDSELKKKKKKMSSGPPKKRRRKDKSNLQVEAENEQRKGETIWLNVVDSKEQQTPSTRAKVSLQVDEGRNILLVNNGNILQ